MKQSEKRLTAPARWNGVGWTVGWTVLWKGLLAVTVFLLVSILASATEGNVYLSILLVSAVGSAVLLSACSRVPCVRAADPGTEGIRTPGRNAAVHRPLGKDMGRTSNVYEEWKRF